MFKMKKRDRVKTQLYYSVTYYVSWERIPETSNRKIDKIICKKIAFRKKFSWSHTPASPSPFPFLGSTTEKTRGFLMLTEGIEREL